MAETPFCQGEMAETPFCQGEMAETREKWQKLGRDFPVCLF